MIHLFRFHLAASVTVWVAIAVPLSVKTTTPAANDATARNPATSKKVPATTQIEARPTTLRRASATITTQLPSTVEKYDSQAQLDFKEDFFSAKGMENGRYEMTKDDFKALQVTEVEVIILESGELEDLLKDVQKRLPASSQSAESEHVLQYFKYVAEENSTEELLSQEFKSPDHQPGPPDAEPEGSILILLGGQSDDIQMENDLDNLSSIEGNMEVGFVFSQLALIQSDLLTSIQYQVWPLMAGVALVTACLLFSCLV